MSEAIDGRVSDRICKHMNEDHADAVLLYAQVFGNCSEATAAQMKSIDPQGMDLDVRVGEGQDTVRVSFDRPLADAEDAHHTLIDMVKQARSRR
jgi:putative heme iron utilization protein